MAERTAIFNLKINDNNSAKKVAQAEAQLEKFRKSALEADKGTGNFENRLKSINKVVDQNAFSLGEANRLIENYQTIAFQAGKDSPVGQEAIKRAAELTDRMAKLRSEVTNLSNDGKNLQGAMQLSQGVLGGYQAFAGVTAMLGVENEELMQTMVKLQAVQQVSMGIEQARKSLEEGQAARLLLMNIRTKALALGTTMYAGAQKALNIAVGSGSKAMKGFRTALVATGIGAIVVGVGLLVENWDKLTNAVNSGAESFKKFAEESLIMQIIMAPIKIMIDGIIAGLEALGIIESEEAKKARELANAKAEQIRKERQEERERIAEKIEGLERERKSIDKKYSFEIRKARAAGKDVTEMERQKMEATITSTKEQIKATDELIKALMEEIKIRMMSGAFSIEQQAELRELMSTRKELAETVKTTSQDLEIFDIQQNKKSIDRSNKTADDTVNIEEQKEAELLKLKQAFTDLSIANIEDEEVRMFAQLQERQIREKKQLKAKYGEDTELLKQLEINQQAEMDALNEKIKSNRSEKEKTEAQAKREEELLRLENDLMFLELDFEERLNKELELERARRDALLANDELTDEERRKIEQEYLQFEENIDQQRIDRANNTAEAIRTAQIDMLSAIGNGIKELANVAQAGEAVQKGIAIAEIAAQTAMGFVRGLGIAQQAAVASGPLAPFVFPTFYATQIASVLSAANKARGILGAGGSTSAPSPTGSNMSSGNTGDSNNLPSFNNRNEQQGESTQETKVIVTETDITRTQKRVSDIEVRSVF